MSRHAELPRLRVAVIGHVEHITLGRIAELPRPGEIVHLPAVDDRYRSRGDGGRLSAP